MLDEPDIAASKRLLALGSGQLAGEQGRSQLCREIGAKRRNDGSQVLGCEHLGRCKKRGLAARVRDREHGSKCDQRLAGTYFALDQAVHGRFAGEIHEDLFADDLLVVRQREWHCRLEFGGKLPGKSLGCCDRSQLCSLLQ